MLDKRESQWKSGEEENMWSGALNNGRIGLFNPNHTVAYIGNLKEVYFTIQLINLFYI